MERRCIGSKALLLLLGLGTVALLAGNALAANALAADAPAADAAKTMKGDLGGGVELELVLVPAGEFAMGAPDAETERQDSETPVHKVKITRPFYLGKFEVTNAQYRRFRADHHSRHLDGDDQPALWVSWYDADAFCRWLAKKAERNVRLPSEAEWEYACRAGTTTRFYSGDVARQKDSADLAKAGWSGGNSRGASQPVGKKAPNAFGLYDTHGNAWEWCGDWYAADYYKQSPDADPPGPPSGRAKVLRGGSYGFWTTYYCRSASRYAYRPDAREPVTGFRVVMEEGPYRERPPRILPGPPLRAIMPADRSADAREAEAAKAFGAPALFVPKADAPVIDGKLDDAAWKLARPVMFRHLNGRAAPPAAPTTARVACDDKNLYVAFDCADDDMARLKIAGNTRDQNLLGGDAVGLFLDPANERTFNACYSIAINPAGVTRDARGYDGAWTPGRYGTGAGNEILPEGVKADLSWNPKLSVAAARSDSGWTVELALPWTELGIAAGEVPTVIGLNLVRIRPELNTRARGKPRLGTLVPHSWPTDDPDLFRMGEETGWAPTRSPFVIRPVYFGHAVIEVGTKKAAPPKQLFELIAREDFSGGTLGRFTKGTLEDGGPGGGKVLRFKAAEGATLFQAPLKEFRDVQILAVLKADAGRGIYWHTFGKMWDDNKCCAREVTTLCRDVVPMDPTFTYCDGAGRMKYTSEGIADPYYAGFSKQLGWYSEPTIGQIHCAGPTRWAVAYTRVGEMFTQNPHCRGVDPERDEVPGWFFHPAGKYDILISEVVMFKGVDNEPPARVASVKCTVEGDKATLSWAKAADNTLTVWYEVVAGEGKDAKTVAESADLSATIPLEEVKGKRLFVRAVDFFENYSEPSAPVEAK